MPKLIPLVDGRGNYCGNVDLEGARCVWQSFALDVAIYDLSGGGWLFSATSFQSVPPLTTGEIVTPEEAINRLLKMHEAPPDELLRDAEVWKMEWQAADAVRQWVAWQEGRTTTSDMPLDLNAVLRGIKGPNKWLGFNEVLRARSLLHRHTGAASENAAETPVSDIRATTIEAAPVASVQAVRGGVSEFERPHSALKDLARGLDTLAKQSRIVGLLDSSRGEESEPASEVQPSVVEAPASYADAGADMTGQVITRFFLPIVDAAHAVVDAFNMAGEGVVLIADKHKKNSPELLDEIEAEIGETHFAEILEEDECLISADFWHLREWQLFRRPDATYVHCFWDAHKSYCGRAISARAAATIVYQAGYQAPDILLADCAAEASGTGCDAPTLLSPVNSEAAVEVPADEAVAVEPAPVNVAAVEAKPKRKLKKVSKAEAETLAEKYLFEDKRPWPGVRPLAEAINYHDSAILKLVSVQRHKREHPDQWPAPAPKAFGISEANESSLSVGGRHKVLNQVAAAEEAGIELHEVLTEVSAGASAEIELRRLKAEREELEAERKRLAQVTELAKAQVAESRADEANRNYLGDPIGRRRKA